MKKVFLVHGYEGSPKGGWFPWLTDKLEKESVLVNALAMPTPDDPKKDEWVKTITEVVSEPNHEIFLVGHSLGVPAILRYLESINNKIGGAVLVSGLCKSLETNDPSYPDKYAKPNSFVVEGFDFEKIKSNCNSFAVIHGDNDNAVPVSHAEYLSNIFSCSLFVVKDGKHLSGDEGIYELPEALEALNKMMGI